MLKTITRSSVVLAAVAASIAVASAATAVLPERAADTARERTAGVTIPGPNAASAGHTSTDATDAAATGAQESEAAGDTHGAAVSELATTTELTGAEKGAAIAAVASDGRSEARGESAGADAGAEGRATGEAKAADASAKGRAKATSARP